MSDPPAGAVLRRMRWWDLAAVLPVERDLFGDGAWTAEAFWGELAHPGTRWYVVAEADAQLVGYAGLHLVDTQGDIQTVAVAPAAQGRGLGRLLVQALIGQAGARGASSLMLEVRADNGPAIALYQGLGFERIAIRRRYYQPEDIDAWVMRLRPITP